MIEAKTAIWDLDGTLIDSFGIYSEVLGDILPEFDRQLPAEQALRENYHGTLNDSISNALGGLTDNEVDKIVERFLASQDRHYEVIEHHIFPDALALAKRLQAQGAFQVLVTNRNHEGRMRASPRSIVERSELTNVINEIICGDDSEHRKPKPEVVEKLVAQGKLTATETVVIGDQFVDAEFAHNLGAQAIIVCREGEPVHMERLGQNWRDTITLVRSLDEV